MDGTMPSPTLTSARRRSRLAALMVAPTVAVMALVAALPIVYAVWLSLHEYSVRVPGLSRLAEPFGLGNYVTALSSGQFWSAMRTTLVFTVVSVALELAIGMAMALLMQRVARGKAFIRAVVLVPWSVLTVVTAIMWRSIFDPSLGFVNSVLGVFGLPDDIVWLGSSPEALFVMTVADVWKTAPFMALLLLAGLQGISAETYEAAAMDGANGWQRFWSITLPLLRPAILVALIFRTLDAMRVFDLPYTLTKGAFGTNTLSLLAYQELQEQGIVGLGSALSVITFVVVMLVSLVYIRLMRQGQDGR
jgi:multiple sugar transport system permease protein